MRSPRHALLSVLLPALPAFALISALALLSSCGSSTEASDSGAQNAGGGTHNGGQTGSLIPICGIAPLTRNGESVPSGEQAFVLDTRGCNSAPRLEELTLTDDTGADVPVQVQQLNPGVYLVKGNAVLMEGEYDVTLPAGVPMPEVTVAVVESAPLPTALGELSRSESECEIGHILLRPSVELASYLPLTQFSYSIDGAAPELASNYGTLNAVGAGVWLYIDSCNAGSCITSGHHRVTVYASIAGETAQPDPASIEFDIRCESDVKDDNSACTLRSGSGGRSAGRSNWFAMGTLGLLWTVAMILRRTPRGTDAS